jgi:hypothetical protein
MSQEKKDATREKERLSKSAKCRVETNEDSAQCRKINCECMKRKCLFETQEESAQHKKTMRECVTKQQQTKTEEQRVNRLNAMVPYMEPLFFELRASLITFQIFVRCQHLIARNVANGFLLFSLVDTF